MAVKLKVPGHGVLQTPDGGASWNLVGTYNKVNEAKNKAEESDDMVAVSFAPHPKKNKPKTKSEPPADV